LLDFTRESKHVDFINHHIKLPFTTSDDSVQYSKATKKALGTKINSPKKPDLEQKHSQHQTQCPHTHPFKKLKIS